MRAGITCMETTNLSQKGGQAPRAAGSVFQGLSACGQHGAKTAVSSRSRSRLRPDSSLPQLFSLCNYLPSRLWALRTATLPPSS